MIEPPRVAPPMSLPNSRLPTIARFSNVSISLRSLGSRMSAPSPKIGSSAALNLVRNSGLRLPSLADFWKALYSLSKMSSLERCCVGDPIKVDHMTSGSDWLMMFVAAPRVFTPHVALDSAYRGSTFCIIENGAPPRYLAPVRSVCVTRSFLPSAPTLPSASDNLVTG